MRKILILLFAALYANAQPRFDLPVSWLTPGPDSSRAIYAYSNGALFRTTDLGQTWIALSIRESGSTQPELSGLLVTPSSPNVIYALGRGRDGAVWKSNDTGLTWRAAGFDLPNSADFVQDAFMDLVDPNLIYVRVGTEVFKSTNGAAGWVRISTLFPAGPYLAFVASPANRRTVFHANSGSVFRSTNEGATWEAVYSAPGSRSLRAVAVDRLNSDFVLTHYSGDVDGTVLNEIVRTNDAGTNWSLTAPAGMLQRLIVATGNIYYGLATNGALVRTSSAANTWNSSAPGFATAIAVDPLDATIVYAGANGVSRSTNAGATFTPLTGTVRPNFTRPAPVAFRIRAGDTASILIPVRAFENPQWAIPFQALTSAPWLQWTSLSGTTPATVAITIDTTGLVPGPYSAEARLQSTQAAATLTIPVTISVDPLGPSSPQFSLAPYGAALDAISALSLDSAANVFAANASGIFRIDRSGPSSRVATLTGVNGLLASSDGSLYIARAAPASLQRFVNGALNTLFTENDARSAGAASFAPLRVRFDPQGRFLIAASGSLLRFQAASSLPITVLAAAPQGGTFADVAADSAGNLFIVDSTRHAVLRWDAVTSQLSVIAGRPGTAGFGGDGGPAGDALLNTPRAIQRASDGTLYLADSGNQRVRAITPDGRIYTIAPPAGETLDSPSDLVLDPDGNLLVSDAGNNRVVQLTALRNLPEISRDGFVNAASNRPFLSPGSLFTIYGSNLSVNLATAPGAPWPTSLGGSSVTINGRAAPLFYISGNQINGQVPYELAAGAAAAIVSSGSLTSSPVTAPVLAAAPGILLYGEDRAVAVNPTGRVNSPSDPTAAGEVITVYLTGIGSLDNPVPTGEAAPSGVLSRATGPHRATIAGRDCEVLFLGLAPGFVGLAQANLRIPTGLATGDRTLVITVNGVDSNPARVAVF